MPTQGGILTKPAFLTKPREESYVDYSLIFIVLFLIAFGLIMLYSTSSYAAAISTGDSAYYFKHQMGPTIIGLIGMIGFSYFPHRFLQKLSVPIYIFAAALLFLIIPYGKVGAK